ncbi:hypothetical protein HDU97_010135 [Phlyctochytrium planicorne]|nr:hypothetical protein HDU97_010135 [Phlyctochytrium planicorne]
MLDFGASSAVAAAAASNFTLTLPCALPLVPDPNRLISKPNCFAGCCIPCPRRRFQGSLIVANNIGVFLLTGSTFLTIPDVKDAICASPVEDATFANNKRCLAQGSLFMFGSCVAVIYAFNIILNLHLNLVWRNRVLEDYAILLHIVSCIAAFAMTFPISWSLNGDVLPTFYCVVKAEKALAWYFAPQSVFVSISVILSIITSGYIYSVSRGTVDDTKKWVKQQIRIQWRSILLTLVFIFTWMQFFLIYEIALPKFLGVDSKTPWVVEWVTCVIKNAPNGQNACLSVSGPNVLDLKIISPCLVIGGMVGFWNVLIFITQPSFFKEWREFVTGTPMDTSTDGGSTHNKSQTTSSNQIAAVVANKHTSKIDITPKPREHSDSTVSSLSRPESVVSPTGMRSRAESSSSGQPFPRSLEGSRMRSDSAGSQGFTYRLPPPQDFEMQPFVPAYGQMTPPFPNEYIGSSYSSPRAAHGQMTPPFPNEFHGHNFSSPRASPSSFQAHGYQTQDGFPFPQQQQYHHYGQQGR